MRKQQEPLRPSDPISKPPGCPGKGYPARLARTLREPKLWQYGCQCNPPRQSQVPASSLQRKTKISATASAGAEIAITVDFSTARLRCHHSRRINTVLMWRCGVNRLMD